MTSNTQGGKPLDPRQGKYNMMEGSATKKLVLFAIPLLIGNVFQQVYNIVDSIVVGRFLGKEALAAVGTAFPIIFLMVGLFMGIGMGANILIAQYYGANDIKKIQETTGTLYIFVFIGSIVMTILGELLNGPILRLMNVPPDVYDYAHQFMTITFLGILPMFGYNTVSAVLRGTGDSKTPLYFLVFSTCLNMVLVVLFVAVFHWGVRGAALATLVSQIAAFVLCTLYLNKMGNVLRIQFKTMHFSPVIFKKILGLGIPSALQQVLVSIGTMAVQSLVNTFGSTTMAGFTAASRIDSFAFMPIMSFGMAISTFVGQNMGAGLMDRVDEGSKRGIQIVSIASVVISALILLVGRPMLAMFNPDPMVISDGMDYLWRVVPFYIILGIMFATTGVLRGAGSVRVPLICTLLSMWLVRVPVAYILVAITGDVNGVWWAFPIGWFLGMIVGYIPYKRGKWKEKQLIERMPIIKNHEMTHEGSEV